MDAAPVRACFFQFDETERWHRHDLKQKSALSPSSVVRGSRHDAMHTRIESVRGGHSLIWGLWTEGVNQGVYELFN